MDYVELYRGQIGDPPVFGDWYWRFIRSNGEEMADSAEGYRSAQHAAEAAAHVCHLDDAALKVGNWERAGARSKRWYFD